MSLFAATGLALSACGGGGGTIAPLLSPASSLTIPTDKGTVRGISGNGVRQFFAIPYAAPPVGSLRFAPPAAHAPFVGTLDATKPGNICPQGAGTAQSPFVGVEDCLNLNVTTPFPAPAGLPVMVWIHGGSFTSGAGVEYDPTSLVNTGNIIVVTINYRLGILGWLGATALDNGTGNTGNYGIEDQVAALSWVHRNIAQFGGNPNNVTVSGESAGAISVAQLLAVPAAQGLFVRAILESGPPAAPTNPVSRAEAFAASNILNNPKINCSGSSAQVVTCLRNPSLTTTSILTVQNSLPPFNIGPTIGADITSQPRTQLGKIPLLDGGNKLELATFLLGFVSSATPGTRLSDATYEGILSSSPLFFYGANGPAVAAEYPQENYPDTFTALSQVMTDYNPSLQVLTLCEDVTSWKIMGAAGGAPLYAYEFADPNAPPIEPGLPVGPDHGSELRYLWPGLQTGSSLPVTQSLATAMQQYWTNFVRNGNPNGNGLPNWPAYTTTTSPLQLIPNAIATGTNVDLEHNCSTFWNPLGLGT